MDPSTLLENLSLALHHEAEPRGIPRRRVGEGAKIQRSLK